MNIIKDSNNKITGDFYDIDGNLINDLKYRATRYCNYDFNSKRNSKKLPNLYNQNSHCCGCTACYSICPVNAIIMLPDNEGFLYPVIDCIKCIRCYKCKCVCPIKHKENI